jgi:hypothetical protein
LGAEPGIGSGEEMNKWAFAAMRRVEATKRDCLSIMLMNILSNECGARSLALKMLLYR